MWEEGSAADHLLTGAALLPLIYQSLPEEPCYLLEAKVQGAAQHPAFPVGGYGVYVVH